MSPRRSTASTSELETENLSSVFQAIRSLVDVVERHVNAGGNHRDKGVETEGSTTKQFREWDHLSSKVLQTQWKQKLGVMQMVKKFSMIDYTKI